MSSSSALCCENYTNQNPQNEWLERGYGVDGNLQNNWDSQGFVDLIL